MRLLLLPAACLLLASLPANAQPQAGPPAPRLPDGGTREVLVSILIPSIADAPFAATVNTRWDRMLGDGTTITLVNHRAIARDGAGRIFQERRLLVPDTGKQESVVTQIEVSDPVAHDLYICVPSAGVCQVETYVPNTASLGRAAPRPISPGARQAPGRTIEDLGKSLMSGLETQGTRETTVIEAGAIGNNSPLRVQREFWYSPRLAVNLLSRLQDPRVGTQNFELSGIVLGEPDAALFQVPPGSKVIDLRNPRETTAAPRQ